MSSKRSKITSKRQVTVPKDVCDDLGVRPGDEIEWVRANHAVRVRKATRDNPFAQWRGYLKDLKGVDVDAMIGEMRGRDDE